jgi:chromosome segregation ATPase
MESLIRKILAFLGFIEKINPTVMTKAADVLPAIESLKSNLNKLNARKVKAMDDIEATREELKQAWRNAQSEASEAGSLERKLNALSEVVSNDK